MMPSISLRELMTFRPPGAFLAGASFRGPAAPPWELGCLFIPLEPRAICQFPFSSARSIHAALLRRIEQVDPAASRSLHTADRGAHSTERPWTVSPLMGLLEEHNGHQAALPGQLYWIRVTALSQWVVAALQRAFTESHSRRDPLFLEGVPFDLVSDEPLWTAGASYSSLARSARPESSFCLLAISPTGFRAKQNSPAIPEAKRCIQGYLRKWKAFSTISLSIQDEQLLSYCSRHLAMADMVVRFETINFGDFTERGLVGSWRWETHSDPSSFLRLVNLLTDYAFFCGTGSKTTMGMGQTIRLRHPDAPLAAQGECSESSRSLL